MTFKKKLQVYKSINRGIKLHYFASWITYRYKSLIRAAYRKSNSLGDYNMKSTVSYSFVLCFKKKRLHEFQFHPF